MHVNYRKRRGSDACSKAINRKTLQKYWLHSSPKLKYYVSFLVLTLMILSLCLLRVSLVQKQSIPSETVVPFESDEVFADNNIELTTVSYKGCSESLRSYKLLLKAQEARRVAVKVVEMETENEFLDWLSTSDCDLPGCVVHLITMSGNRQCLGSTDDLSDFIVGHEDIFGTEFFAEDLETEDTEEEEEEEEEEIPDIEVPSSLELPNLTKQVDFEGLQRLIVTPFRKNPEKQITNHRVLWQYLVDSKGWKLKWRTPGQASLVFVQDQTSAAQALRYKNTLVNNIGMGGQSCYGGSKGAQQTCRMQLAESHGCDYDDLKIQPPQYRFWIEEECSKFFDTVCDTIDANGVRTTNEPTLWIEKPSFGQHGGGMKVHRGCEDMRKRWGKCNKANLGKRKAFVMEYIDPALLEGHKFDLRTFLLVASLDPLLVFYHDGFVRRAGTAYDSDLKDTKAHITNAHSQDNVEDHFWDFGRLEKYLHEQLGFPEDYMRNNFKQHAMKIENFVFQAARSNMFKRKGTFQLFALDWIIDSKGGIHMLEANSNPLVTNYPIPGYPETWESMMDLVLKIHTNPESIAEPLVTIPSTKRFKYDTWELIFNENEELSLGLQYNSCEALQGLNQAPFAENSFNEEELLKAIQKKLRIEDEHLQQLALQEVSLEQSVSKTEQPEVDIPLVEPSLSPREVLQEIISKNQPRVVEFAVEDFSCSPVEVGFESHKGQRCLLGAGSSVETFFYVFEPVTGFTEDMPTVMVVSGVHGNEPSGVIATNVLKKQMALFEARLVIVERVNSVGVLKSQRYLNENKLDPNRIFPDSLTEPPKGKLGVELWKVVEHFQPDLFFDFHEGWGIYAALKDNPNPSGKLVGNKKFSKGSSVICSTNAEATVEAVTTAINTWPVAEPLLSILRSELQKADKPSEQVFLGISPPIAGGLAQRVTRFFGSMSFVQETTSRQGAQPLELRARHHLMLFTITMQQLGLPVASEALIETCSGDISCIRDSELDWILSLEIPPCVAGRANCRLVYPDDTLPPAPTEQPKKEVDNVLLELQGVLDQLETS